MLCMGFGIRWEGEELLRVLASGEDDGQVIADGVRFAEAETAISLGIPFDEHWYSIPVNTREQMIAARLARTAISNLQHMKAASR